MHYTRKKSRNDGATPVYRGDDTMKKKNHVIRKGIIIGFTGALCAVSAIPVMAGADISEDLLIHLSEASGLDVSEIEQTLESSGMTQEQLMEMSEEDILEGLRVGSRQNSTKDFSYLFSTGSISQTLDGHTLQRVAVYSSDDAISPSLMIDYEEQLIYYSGGIRIFDNLDLAESVRALDGETAEEVRAIVQEILEKGYDPASGLLSDTAAALAGLAIETDLGVTSFTVQNVEGESSLEQSNYISRIFRIYYDHSGQDW